MPEPIGFEDRLREIEAALRRIEGGSDPATRAVARDLVKSLMDLHAAAIGRMLEIAYEKGEPGAALIDSWGQDPVTGGILLLYGLHPLDLETRVRQALDKASPVVHARGGRLELLGVADGIVSLRLHGVGDRAGAAEVKARVDAEIYAAAPDAVAVHGLEMLAAPDFVPIGQLVAAPGAQQTEAALS